MKKRILKMLNLDVRGNEKVRIQHHRVLHLAGHMFGMAFGFAVVAHFRFTIGYYLLAVVPLVKEFIVDGHLKRILEGRESKKKLNDLRADLISWYAGSIGLVTLI